MRGSPSIGFRGVLAAQVLAVALAVMFTTEARAQTSGYNVTSASSVQFYVNGAPWADLHYTINGGGQLNYRMVASGTNHTYSVTGIPSGATVRYFFTIGNSSGGAIDTAWAQFTMTGSGGGGGGTGNWTVVWEDTFSGSGQPSSANWNYHVGNGYNQGSFVGWGNGEWEWYRPENAYQQNGNLVIRADYTNTPLVVAGRNWYQRSARITTKGKKSWKYGRIEARIAMPNAIGTWPAFWMMGTACDDGYTSNYAAPTSYYDVMATNWSSCGEIDIMEHRNTETNTFQNLFWDSRTGLFPWGNGLNNEQPSNINVGNVTQFHLYTIEWEPTQIRWYVDRESHPTPVHTVDITAANKEEFHRPFYIILNLALSGQFTGYAQPNQADFPLYMYVDYVRVWQKQ
ncbi:glycoside hydrolase family 16 protein [Hyalangium gracile]|uniref:glycoside hydrolase family 16 protein n=1 Tax=Hyalangium gracile TaxID=394092 RepID=UPI001CC99A22|nr:glycoside hydrolase family 16 protein [Hyalangium gracile]